MYKEFRATLGRTKSGLFYKNDAVYDMVGSVYIFEERKCEIYGNTMSECEYNLICLFVCA